MIIADTGFWLVLSDEKDSYHQAANQAFQTHDEPLITTWPVMTETCYLLLDRIFQKPPFMRRDTKCLQETIL